MNTFQEIEEIYELRRLMELNKTRLIFGIPDTPENQGKINKILKRVTKILAKEVKNERKNKKNTRDNTRDFEVDNKLERKIKEITIGMVRHNNYLFHKKRFKKLRDRHAEELRNWRKFNKKSEGGVLWRTEKE